MGDVKELSHSLFKLQINHKGPSLWVTLKLNILNSNNLQWKQSRGAKLDV